MTILAVLLQTMEVRLAGEPYLEALVRAILLGVLIRTLWEPGPVWRPGIDVSGQILLGAAEARPAGGA